VVKIELKTNLGFFLIFISIIILAFIEGNNISNAISSNDKITGGEIHLISFVFITIFMLVVALFKPHKQNLVSYSAITLSLVTILTTLFDNSFDYIGIIKASNLIASAILIIGGVMLISMSTLNKEQKELSKKALSYYKK
jgi:hypothetical protein